MLMGHFLLTFFFLFPLKIEVTLLAGSVDFFVPELLIGAVGLIPGAGNVFPSLCVELQRLYENGQLKEAVELQRQLVEPDDAICRWHGIPGAKSYIQSKLGYGNGVTRNPLHSATDSQKARIVEAVEKAFALESEFQKKK
jgi:L-threo-3-deoxy-hexylosonate aldolase